MEVSGHLLLQFSSVAQSCPTLYDPMNRSTPGLPVHHQLPEFTQTHVHRVRDAIQPSHPRSSPSPPAPNPSQHQSLFQWVNSSHEESTWKMYISGEQELDSKWKNSAFLSINFYLSTEWGCPEQRVRIRTISRMEFCNQVIPVQAQKVF